MRRRLREGFYGWRIVAASFVILFITVGVGIYSPPVFLLPLQEAFGWSRAAISAAMAIAALMSGLLSPLVGGWIDRYGARKVMSLGALTMGIAFALLSLIGALWQLYAINVIAAVGVTCVAWIPNQTLVANWFERKRGLAMGIALAGIGFGGLAIAPLGGALIAWVGWRLAYLGLASLILVIVLALTLTVVRSRPADLGLLPDGDPLRAQGADGSRSSDALGEAAPEGLGLADALRTSAFWTLWVCNLLAIFAGFSIIAHIVAFLSDSGFDPKVGALSLGLAIGASVAGRLLFGLLADRFPKRYVMALALLLQAVSTLFLFRILAFGSLPAFVITFGLALGGTAVLLPLLVGECFGLRSFATILGATMIAATLGVAVGPVLTGYIFDVTGSYRLAFLLDLAGFLLAAACICFLRQPAGAGSRVA